MFADFPAQLLQEMASEPVTSNFHYWSLSVQVIEYMFKRVIKNTTEPLNVDLKYFFFHLQNFSSNEILRHYFMILTTNVHGNVEFVSTMEGKTWVTMF